MVLDNVTLFEVHLPTDRFSGDDADESTHEQSSGSHRTGGEHGEDESSGKGRSVVGLLVGAVLLAGIALGVRRLRSGGSDEAYERAYRQPDVETEA